MFECIRDSRFQIAIIQEAFAEDDIDFHVSLARGILRDMFKEKPGLHPADELANLSEEAFRSGRVISETAFHLMMIPNQLRMVMLINQHLVKLTEISYHVNAKKMVEDCLRAIIQEHRSVYDSKN